MSLRIAWTIGETVSKQVNKCNKPLWFFVLFLQCKSRPGTKYQQKEDI